MALGGFASRRIAAGELAAMGGAPVERLMMGPVAITPMTRHFVAAQRDRYVTGDFRWLRQPHIDPATMRSFPQEWRTSQALEIATGTVLGRRFLSWARFPLLLEEPTSDGGVRVHLIDLRYADRPGAGFGTVTILVNSRSP
jgi:hypothetical protein